MPPEKADYTELKEGYEFPRASFSLDSATIDSYLKAVGEDSVLYQNTSFVPPMAITALAMTALSESVSFPPGAIHVSQEVEFLDVVKVNDVIVSQAKVRRNQKRGPLHLMAIEFHVFRDGDKKVLLGKTEFISPDPGVAISE